jgi:hypothetical protein
VPPTPTATPVPPTATPAPLPPEPRVINFQAPDGAQLSGLFFPAAVKPAPVIVFMHDVGFDQSEWREIAFWLQNRGQGGKTPNPRNFHWLDPTWFPPMLAGKSFAVFTFNYRGCGADGCRSWTPREWLLDSQGAMKAAAELDGVNPQQILSSGSSIGSDGAADGCFWLNQQGGKGKCIGTLQWSPGNYLTIAYADAVKALQGEQPPKPTWCFTSEGDREAAPTCRAASGPAYKMTLFPGNQHAIGLINRATQPNPLQLFLDWIKLSLGL